MPHNKVIRAVFPGAFDPITNGHLDIIKRAVSISDELIIAVGHNPEKDPIFDAVDRVEMIEELIADLPSVRVQAYSGLTAHFVHEVKATIMIRGIRDTVDLHF